MELGFEPLCEKLTLEFLSVSEVLSKTVHSPRHYAEPPVRGTLYGMVIRNSKLIVQYQSIRSCAVPVARTRLRQ